MPEPQSFYRICLQRVYSLLKRGTWASCSSDPDPPFPHRPNPFSFLPSQIVDDVMNLYQSDPLRESPRIADVLLLLKSGRLTCLDLTHFRSEEDYELIKEITNVECCRSMRLLLWFSRLPPDNTLPVQLVSSCHKLEIFYSNTFPPFSVFENCPKLRILRFGKPFGEMHDFMNSISESSLRSLTNLESFYICDLDIINLTFHGAPIAKILLNCPKLISLGPIDSLDGLKVTYDRILNASSSDMNPGHLQLRRCFWGRNIESDPETRTLPVLKSLGMDVSTYKSSYPEKVRIAVSLCPLVKELGFYALHRDSVKELKRLKHLSILYISFRDCDDDYVPAFIDLLQAIGPQLKKLAVHCPVYPLPVDIVCDLCPNLQTLNFGGEATVSNPAQSNCKILLKHLQIIHANQNSLLFMLSRCQDVEVLFLDDVRCLEDELLYRILRVNTFPNLRVLRISNSSISLSGVRVFLERAVSLEKVCFSVFGYSHPHALRRMFKELSLDNVTYFEHKELRSIEQKYFLADEVKF